MRGWPDNALVTGEAGQGSAGPRPTWCEGLVGRPVIYQVIVGHARSSREYGRTVWSWMIIGHENQVLVAGQAGDRSAAKRLVEGGTDG
jgi:hypothetical protein